MQLVTQTRTSGYSEPLSTYSALAAKFGSDRAFLMESLSGPERDNRFSLCGLAGLVEVAVYRGRVLVTGNRDLTEYLTQVIADSNLVTSDGGVLTLVDDEAFWSLPRILSDSFELKNPGNALASSFLAFYGYDAVRYVEQLPRLIADSVEPVPDAVFSLVDTLITHRDDTTEVAINECGSANGPSFDSSFESVMGCLVTSDPISGDVDNDSVEVPPVPKPKNVTDDISKSQYFEKGKQCLEHIRLGDIYQVQLGHSITIESEATPLDVYHRLRWRNPSPYMALMNASGSTIVCASPELFVRTTDTSAAMRPIAGTVSKGDNHAKAKAALLGDPKERAEHLMLVDLCRNDLGRVAVDGSVDTTTFMTIEEYSHVFHIVSEVQCATSAETDVYDVIKASFPAGTMSGAPKVRAMEIIESLETSRRGFYAGAFGLLSLNKQDSVLGLAIRMAVHNGNSYSLRASAGFVADSTLEGEWNETFNKLASTYWAVSGEEIR